MGYSVLVLDDSSVMRKIISRNLRQGGVQVDQLLEAGDGNEGLAQLTNQKCDLILSDVNMPNMDGLTFVKEVRRRTELNRSKIIMITTEAGVDIMDEAMSTGADGYILKPFTPDQLSAKIKAVMN